MANSMRLRLVLFFKTYTGYFADSALRRVACASLCHNLQNDSFI